MNKFTTPCSSNCLCVRGICHATKEIHARLRYEVGKETFEESLVAVVPATFHRGEWLGVLSCKTRELIEPKGSHYGVLDFRLDGSDKPVTWGERLKDLVFTWTWRGTPVTGSYFVPIWSRFLDSPPSVKSKRGNDGVFEQS